MKLRLTIAISLLIVLGVASATTRAADAARKQSGKTYNQMTTAERATFVAERSRAVARRLSNSEYEFTSSFEAEIGKAIDSYASRINNGQPGTDLRLVVERGATYAPRLAAAFERHGLSPLFGLYIPWIEAEYLNPSAPNSVGAVGLFQFLPQTGKRFGLTVNELIDADKAADAAARYIKFNLDLFRDQTMKEALALLAYNRGERAVRNDLQRFADESACSICRLTERRDELDETFRGENAYYVPRFFAAAIIGENPREFGLMTQPLSSYKGDR